MRTYSRKKVEYKMIEGVKERCRLCLGKCDEVVPIFTDASEVCAALPMRIMICIGLEMVREDCLSNMICKNCHEEIEKYYSFRKKCEVTYQKLKAHVTFMKEQAVIAAQMNLKSEVNEVRNENVEQRVEMKLPSEDVEDGQLVLTFNENDLQVVDVVSWNEVSVTEKPDGDLVSSHILPMQVKEQEHTEENVVQLQDISTTSQTPISEAPTEADLSSLLTSILLRLGILSQEGELLELADLSFQDLELEGDDGETITLDLIEEDDPSLAICIPQEVQETEEPSTDDVSLTMVTLEPTRPVAPAHLQKHKKTVSKTHKDTTGKRPRSLGGGGVWCLACGKMYSTRSALARHQRSHSAERPYVCPHCGRAFTQKAVLTRHELVHAERPYACESCPARFTQRGALVSHARRHAPPHARALELHRCSSCAKVFLHASGLSRHMSVHEGRVYQCADCGRKFRDKSALTRHFKNVDHKKHKAS